jgi:hypothetical protein
MQKQNITLCNMKNIGIKLDKRGSEEKGRMWKKQ